jgi:hypothetical protein
MTAHWEFVLANFSGVLCLDEVHDSGRTILFATDPLGDFTVSFTLVETNDQDHMNTFLQALKDRGLDVQVAMTDGSPLYKDSVQRYWTDIEPQRCIFHVITEGNKLILDGGTRRQKSPQATGPQRPQEASRSSQQESAAAATIPKRYEQERAGHLYLGPSVSHRP